MVKRTVEAPTRANVATPDDLGALAGFLEGAGQGAGTRGSAGRVGGVALAGD